MGAYNRDYLFRGFSMRYKLVRGILLLEVYRFRGRGEGGGGSTLHTKTFFMNIGNIMKSMQHSRTN